MTPPSRRRLTRRFAAIVACAAAPLTGAACAGAASDWEPAAVRAVAREVEAMHPGDRIVVLATIGTGAGTELPWGVRQALTTGGLEVAAAGAPVPADAVLLTFERSAERDGEWWIDTQITGSALPADGRMAWRVRCQESRCEARQADG